MNFVDMVYFELSWSFLVSETKFSFFEKKHSYFLIYYLKVKLRLFPSSVSRLKLDFLFIKISDEWRFKYIIKAEN